MSNTAKQLGSHTIRPLSQQVKKNYTNQKFHSAVDLAKLYSGMVQTHLDSSKYENHVFSSIDRSYKNPQLLKSKSLGGLKSQKMKQSPIKKQSVKLTNQKLAGINPELNQESQSVLFQQKSQIIDRAQFMRTKDALNKRVVRVPEYSQSLKQKCETKKNLDQYIAELKRMITQQKKMKTKISLNCNKIMNQRQLTHANTCKKVEENYNLSVKIAAQNQACVDLSEQNNQLRRKIAQTNHNISMQRELRDKLKKYVEETRIVLRNQERDVAQMKQWVSAAINNMSNNFQYVNQLKQQKALLLSDIDNNYRAHG